MPHSVLTDRLGAGPVICAEGFLCERERRGYLTAGEFVPEVALEHPEALRSLHVDFQRAGSDIVEAFTYNGHREKIDRKSTRLNSSHVATSYAVFRLKKKNKKPDTKRATQTR